MVLLSRGHVLPHLKLSKLNLPGTIFVDIVQQLLDVNHQPKVLFDDAHEGGALYHAAAICGTTTRNKGIQKVPSVIILSGALLLQLHNAKELSKVCGVGRGGGRGDEVVPSTQQRTRKETFPACEQEAHLALTTHAAPRLL